MVNEVSATKPLKDQGEEHRLKRLKEVCADFESMLLSQMLKSMTSAIGDLGVFGKNHESQLIRSMMDEHLSVEIARKRGIGIGEMLFRKLEKSKNYLTSFPGFADKTIGESHVERE